MKKDRFSKQSKNLENVEGEGSAIFCYIPFNTKQNSMFLKKIFGSKNIVNQSEKLAKPSRKLAQGVTSTISGETFE